MAEVPGAAAAKKALSNPAGLLKYAAIAFGVGSVIALGPAAAFTNAVAGAKIVGAKVMSFLPAGMG